MKVWWCLWRYEWYDGVDGCMSDGVFGRVVGLFMMVMMAMMMVMMAM